MATTFSLAVSGNLRRFLALEAKVIATSVPAVLRKRVGLAKRSLRRQVTTAGLGRRLANTVRTRVTPEKGPALEASGLIYSSALKGLEGRTVNLEAALAGTQPVVDLLTVFGEGATIRATQGRFLAIPVGGRAAPRTPGRGSRKKTPADYPAGALRFVPARTGTTALLVDAEDRVLFLLVKQARIRARLNIARVATQATVGLDEALATDIAQRLGRLAAAAGIL